MKRRRTTRRAFSLIELLIAIAILLAIGGLVVVNLLPRKEQADADLTRGQIDSMVQAIKLFKLDMKRVPTEDEGLAALWSKSALEDEDDAEGWTSAYLETPIPEDTWGNEWVYRQPSTIREGAEFDIVSLGPDGEEETEDDIHNHLRFMDEEGELDEAFDDFGADEDFGGGG